MDQLSTCKPESCYAWPKKAISETKKAYKIQDKQGPSDGFEAFTIEDTAEIYALLVGAESAIESAVSKLEEAKNMMPNFDKGKNT